MSCRAALSLAVVVALAACESCPPDAHVITGMRVLGTTFDPPIAPPGGAVTVRAVTADVEDRALDVAWYRCPTNLQLAAIASEDGGLDASRVVEPCLAAGAFARGVSVRVSVDAQGGRLDPLPYRTPRRWTDLVGFACAGGSIEPPPVGGLWPRCTGARGVVFTASIPGPFANGDAAPPAPATITNLRFDGSAWGEGVAPTVPRCEGSRASCAGYRLRFAVADATAAVELSAGGTGALGGPADAIAYVSWHVTGMARPFEESCAPFDTEAVLQPDGAGGGASVTWVPPSRAGEVTFWFTARRYSGGLDVVRRAVRVE